MVSVDGNLYSVPDTTRRHPVEVHSTADEVRILGAGHRDRRAPRGGRPRPAPHHAGHRTTPAPVNSQTPCHGSAPGRSGKVVALGPLAFYDAVGKRLATDGAAA